MNILSGNIKSITTSGELSLIQVECNALLLSAILIDTPETAPYLRQEQPVKVMFKETEVVLGKGTDFQISLQNRLEGTIMSIEKGTLLSKVILSTDCGNITSIITSRAIDQLELTTGSVATAMVKTNEIMLSE